VFAWIQAVQDFLGSPLTGIGTGSFALNTPWLDLYWPHNLFLEMACENGLIGLGLILFFVVLVVIYGFKNIFFYAKCNLNIQLQLSIASSCLFAFSLWNSMFSGDISTNPVVWFSAGLIYALHPSDDKTTAISN
jgi:O-antigen ligase